MKKNHHLKVNNKKMNKKIRQAPLLGDFYLINKKKRCESHLFLIEKRQRSILPARLQASTFDPAKLNFCVRNGNRWTFAAWSPLMV